MLIRAGMASSPHILPSYSEKQSRGDEAGEAGVDGGGRGVGWILLDHKVTETCTDGDACRYL